MQTIIIVTLIKRMCNCAKDVVWFTMSAICVDMQVISSIMVHQSYQFLSKM